MPKQRRHHRNDGLAGVKSGYRYKQTKKIAEKLGIRFGTKEKDGQIKRTS